MTLQRLLATMHVRQQFHGSYVHVVPTNTWFEKVSSPGMKPVDHFLVNWSICLAVYIDGVIQNLRVWIPPLSMRFLNHRVKSQPRCHCKWQRVGRHRWTDHALRVFGWYPWQCRVLCSLLFPPAFLVSRARHSL